MRITAPPCRVHRDVPADSAPMPFVADNSIVIIALPYLPAGRTAVPVDTGGHRRLEPGHHGSEGPGRSVQRASIRRKRRTAVRRFGTIGHISGRGNFPNPGDIVPPRPRTSADNPVETVHAVSSEKFYPEPTCPCNEDVLYKRYTNPPG